MELGPEAEGVGRGARKGECVEESNNQYYNGMLEISQGRVEALGEE